MGRNLYQKRTPGKSRRVIISTLFFSTLSFLVGILIPSSKAQNKNSSLTRNQKKINLESEQNLFTNKFYRKPRISSSPSVPGYPSNNNLEQQFLKDLEPNILDYRQLASNPQIASPTNQNNLFRLIFQTGKVTIDGKKSAVGQTITAGSVVETDETGMVIYRFFNESVKLYPNSRITHGNNPNNWGELYGSMTVTLTNSSNPRRIFLPNSTILVNGSGMHINTYHQIYGRNSEIIYGEYICTCYGKSIIQRPTNPNNFVKINSNHHDFPYIATPAHYLSIKKVIGHSDSDLIEIANLLI